MTGTTPENEQPAKKPIGLKEFISRIEQELLDSQGDQAFFVLGSVELEISIAVERGINGGINLKVIEVGGEGKQSNVQTVRVRLEPLITGDEIRQYISDKAKKLAIAKSLVRASQPAQPPSSSTEGETDILSSALVETLGEEQKEKIPTLPVKTPVAVVLEPPGSWQPRWHPDVPLIWEADLLNGLPKPLQADILESLPQVVQSKIEQYRIK